MKLVKTSHPFEVKIQKDNGFFCGYASVFDVIDCQHEQVARGAFEKSLQRSRQAHTMPYMLWQHEVKMPIGFWKNIYEDAKGLFVEGNLLLEVKQAQEAYSLMKVGAIRGLSIGYKTLKSRKHKTLPCRVLEELELHEISLVTFAANPQAHVMQCKESIDGFEYTAILQKLHELSEEMRGEVP